MLSHYTSRDGLEGILKTEILWATNFLDLNDKSEFFYAWNALARHAVAYFFSKLPDDLKPEESRTEGILATINSGVRSLLVSEQTTAGHLYVTSFARASNEDQQRRGILTLWDRYTRFEGYCLQFSRSSIVHALQLEAVKGNYVSVDLVDVVYGVDQASWEFKAIGDQLGELWLLQAARETGDSRIRPDYENSWALSYLLRQIMAFCARHKDPCFEDEREIRMFLYPAEKAECRVFTGVAGVKNVQRSPSGKRILAIGEFWKPGILPDRIIIGPKADENIRELLIKFNIPPVVSKSSLPIV